MQLPHEAKAIGGIPLRLFVVEAAGGLEVAQPHAHTGVLHRRPQHTDRAAMVECGHDDLEELLPRRRLPAVARHELFPRLRLRRLDERDDLVAEDAGFAVVCRGVEFVPAVTEQVGLDVCLEGGLVGDAHGRVSFKVRVVAASTSFVAARRARTRSSSEMKAEP
jgi:hypothetical protein